MEAMEAEHEGEKGRCCTGKPSPVNSRQGNCLRSLILLGGDSRTVYRFLAQHRPKLDSDNYSSGLRDGKVNQVLAPVAENTAEAFS